ncbi:myb-like protein X [Vespula maculifrons]|uniref:Myb-like protein X n=1 Tax=Vespula maculifrons TaxID=7453 RepID=A0ABD2AGF8_VESMC
MEDRFNGLDLDADPSANKFESNQTDVGLWPNIDFADLDSTSNILTRCTVRRKLNGSSRPIGSNNNNNMQITETDIENRRKHESRLFIHVLKNELRKNGNGTKE